MRERQAGPEHPRWFERHPRAVRAWSDRLVHAVVAGVVIGVITWRVALGMDATSTKAITTAAVVGLLLAANYSLLVLVGRRSANFYEEHPWVSALTLPVPLAVLLSTLHYLRGEASLADTLVSSAVLVVLGGAVWRFLNPLR